MTRLLLPGYKYCGPGNPLPNGPPVNKLDEVCMKHDYCYAHGISEYQCDQEMSAALKKIPWYQRNLSYFLVRVVIGAKQLMKFNLY